MLSGSTGADAESRQQISRVSVVELGGTLPAFFVVPKACKLLAGERRIAAAAAPDAAGA